MLENSHALCLGWLEPLADAFGGGLDSTQRAAQALLRGVAYNVQRPVRLAAPA